MRRTVSTFSAAVLAAFLFAPAPAAATPILLSSPVITSGPVTGAAVVATIKPSGWVSGTWYSPSADQRFVSPYVAGTDSLPGDYVYTVSFNLTGFDPATAALSGTWTTDNQGQIYLNGIASAFTRGTGDYGTAVAFSFTSGFNSGLNTLAFHVTNENCAGQGGCGPTNGENPTGVFYTAAASANAAAVPEPATLGLVGAGLLGLARRRFRSRQS